MTLFPTHFSLEGLLLWSFLPRSEKAIFKKNKALFWLVLSFSLLPDIDIFFGNHRGFSHSFIIPLFLVIVGMFFHIQHSYNNKKNKPINSIGVVGISDVFDEITKTYQNRVKVIKYGNFTILLEYENDPKSQFLFVLFVDKNMKSLQLFLNKVKTQFLNSYGGLLANFDIVDKFRETLFSGFDVVLQNILD